MAVQRKIYQQPEVAKCDLCKKITGVQFRFDIMTREDNAEFIYSSMKVCSDCASKLSHEWNLSEIQDEYVLYEERII